jgi:hypothetical protein
VSRAAQHGAKGVLAQQARHAPAAQTRDVSSEELVTVPDQQRIIIGIGGIDQDREAAAR